MNLSKQSFSTGSGRLTLKNCLKNYFHLLKSSNFRLYCRFLNVMVFICKFLLYYDLSVITSKSDKMKHGKHPIVIDFTQLYPFQLEFCNATQGSSHKFCL